MSISSTSLPTDSLIRSVDYSCALQDCVISLIELLADCPRFRNLMRRASMMSSEPNFRIEDNGSLEADLNFTLPEPALDDLSATEAQQMSVSKLCGYLPDGLTYAQAHALLSYRNCARAVVEDGMSDFSRGLADVFVQLLACNISQNQHLAQAAISWSEYVFEHGEECLPIARTQIYHDVSETAARWLDQLERAGYRFPE